MEKGQSRGNQIDHGSDDFAERNLADTPHVVPDQDRDDDVEQLPKDIKSNLIPLTSKEAQEKFLRLFGVGEDDCAVRNLTDTPHVVPDLDHDDGNEPQKENR